MVTKEPPSDKRASLSSRVDDWWERSRFHIYVTALIILLLVFVLWPRIFILVPAGHQGVMFRTFMGGTVTSRLWGEGFHIIPPWDSMSLYETRIQERKLDFPVLSNDGLRLELLVSVRFHPYIGTLGRLHKEIGPDYFVRLIRPEVEAHLRRTIGDRTAYQLYSNEGDILQEASNFKLEVKSGASQYVRMDKLMIRQVSLPLVVREAIEEKHRQEQKLLEYDFRIGQSEKEAERKRIEASGIRDYNIIAKEISPALLRWRGIEATLSLAESNNAKIIVIGGGQDGLPVILDTRSDAQPVVPPEAPDSPEPLPDSPEPLPDSPEPLPDSPEPPPEPAPSP